MKDTPGVATSSRCKVKVTRGPYRSAAWLTGESEMALTHRAAFRMAGVKGPLAGRPVIGIANSASDLNPCNLPLHNLALAVGEGVREAGGIPLIFPTMSLGEDLMKPSAMLYRDLLAIEVEETLRANPLDGVVLLANCDKTTPAMLMGAISANLPTVLVTGGPRPAAHFRGQRVGSGTGMWKMWDKRRAGDVDQLSWEEFEQCLGCHSGACNTMGTACTMGVLSEAMGVAVLGSTTKIAGSTGSTEMAKLAGKSVVGLVERGVKLGDIVDERAFRNAAIMLGSVGGSTNAVVHLIAMARRRGLSITSADLVSASCDVPLIADVAPTGKYLVEDLDREGGAPAIMFALRDYFDLSAMCIQGGTIMSTIRGIGVESRQGAVVIRGLDRQLNLQGLPAFRLLRGTLAPGGALLRVATASAHLLNSEGPAVVFDGYQDMISRLDSGDAAIERNSVIVLRNGGPIGGPGMPEWGMVPIPEKLLALGVQDMLRVTDARMSGTSYGTVVLHVTPEAAIGGPLGLVEHGDRIALDVDRGRLDLKVDAAEIDRRRARWRPASYPENRGWIPFYRSNVSSATEGCVLRCWDGIEGAMPGLIEPVVGRS